MLHQNHSLRIADCGLRIAELSPLYSMNSELGTLNLEPLGLGLNEIHRYVAGRR